MATKLFPVVLVIGFIFWVAQAQSQLLTGTPTESSTPPKHPTQKTTQTTSPAESTTSTSEAESPAASPKPKRTRKKSTAEASPTPTPTAVASPTPRKFRFPRLFKPKRSASPTPLGMNSGPASGSGTAAGADASPCAWRIGSARIAARFSSRDLVRRSCAADRCHGSLIRRSSQNCNLIVLGRLPQACTTKVQYHIRAELRIFTVQLNETIATLKVQ